MSSVNRLTQRQHHILVTLFKLSDGGKRHITLLEAATAMRVAYKEDARDLLTRMGKDVVTITASDYVVVRVNPESLAVRMHRPRARLTEEKVRYMRQLRKNEKFTYAQLAERFGISHCSAQRACDGRTWSEVA